MGSIHGMASRAGLHRRGGWPARLPSLFRPRQNLSTNSDMQAKKDDQQGILRRSLFDASAPRYWRRNKKKKNYHQGVVDQLR